MFGGVDRGGGREGKKSLRKNKIAINKFEKSLNSTQKEIEFSSKKDNPPLPLFPSVHKNSTIDTGCSLLNRRLINDQGKIITRAQQAGIETIITMCNDYDKQKELLDVAKQHDGILYCMIGLHPDNIKRNYDKSITQKMEGLKGWLMLPQSVAIFCALDHSRDIGTHYTQEKVLKEHIDLAIELEMPIVIHQIAAVETLVEFLKQDGKKLKGIAIYNFCGTESEMDQFLNLGLNIYFIISGIICESSDRGERLRDITSRKIPEDRLLVASDSPFSTPQNIEDSWVKERHNEPSNLPYVIQAISSAKLNKKDDEDITRLSQVLRQNNKNFFGLLEKAEYDELKSSKETTKEKDVDGEANEEDLSKEVEGIEISEDKKINKSKNDKKPKNNSKSKPSTTSHVGFEDESQSKSSKSKKQNEKGKGKEKETEKEKEKKIPVKNTKKIEQKSESESENESVNESSSSETEIEDKKTTTTTATTEVKKPLSTNPMNYACKKCRKILFVSTDTISHESEQLEYSKGKKNRQRTNKPSDLDVCRNLFLNELDWIKHSIENKPQDKEDESEDESDEDEDDVDIDSVPSHLQLQGKLSCPNCNSKLGRWSKVSPIECSCGKVVPSPVFMIVKKNIDMVTNIQDVNVVSSTYTQLYLDDDELLNQDLSQNTTNTNTKKQKKKKIVKKDNSSNFSNYRNKDTRVSNKKKEDS